MKLTFPLIMLLFFNIGHSQNNTTCVYGVKKNEVAIKRDKNESESLNFAKNLIDKALNKSDKLKYLLVYNDKESIFKLKNNLAEDTEENQRFLKLVEVMVATGIYYQNLYENLILHEFEVFGEEFLTHQPLKNSNWNITKKKKKIGKYICYKAINICESCNDKNIIEVWFTPDIPVPFGPMGYGGLPGLIIEVKKKRVTLTLIEINNTNTLKIKKPKKGRYLTLQEYKKIAKDIRSHY